VTETEASESVAAMVAADSEPVLNEVEVAYLVELARRPDPDGLLPGDVGWRGAYNLSAAAAEGWRRKAGKVAGQFSFSADGQTFHRAEMYKACLDMAQRYANRIAGSVPTGTGDDYANVVGN
jgi:hypothetical protein